MKLYVAVVCRKQNMNSSKYADGQWAAFVAESQDAAAEKALKACRKWSDSGPYDVLVGTLTAEAKPVSNYDLVPLKKTGGK